MKLKCVEHNRRVHALDRAVTVHREDGSRCGLDVATGVYRDPALKLGKIRTTATRVRLFWHGP